MNLKDVAIITDNIYYYEGLKKTKKKSQPDYIDPLNLIERFEGVTNIIASKAVLIKVSDPQLLLSVIMFINHFSLKTVVIEYTEVAFDVSATMMKVGIFFLIVTKYNPDDLESMLENCLCNADDIFELPLHDIKLSEWKIFFDIAKHGNAKNTSIVKNISQKKISVLKRSLNRKLCISTVNIISGIQVMTLVSLLYKLSIMDSCIPEFTSIRMRGYGQV